MKKYAHLVRVLAMSLGLMFVIAIPAIAQEDTEPPTGANIANNVCRGVLATQEDVVKPEDVTIDDCGSDGTSEFDGIIRRIINVFSVVVGAVSVIMIIIGGFRYIISGGDSTGVSGAKNTILYAVVGLVIVLFAQAIVFFIVDNVATDNNDSNNQQNNSQTAEPATN